MSRQPRFNLPGVPQHVIQRGNNREPCLFAEADYIRYMDDLYEEATKNHAAIHAYVLMTNHVHILVTPGSEFNITHMMQDLGRKYVRYINHSYKKSGTLWEGRYKASLVDSEIYLLTCMRNIEINPVRAGMVETPGEYKWSSYTANSKCKSIAQYSVMAVSNGEYRNFHCSPRPRVGETALCLSDLTFDIERKNKIQSNINLYLSIFLIEAIRLDCYEL